MPAALFNAVQSTGTLFGNGTPGGIGDPANPTPASNPHLASRRTAPTACCPTCRSSGPAPSEHPPAIPAAGAQFLASKLEALAANEDLWNSTVFIINYDENDGFFDHVVPPTPDPRQFPEEFVTLASPAGHPRRRPAGRRRVPGAGVRHLAVDVGGRIFSEVSDHTSCLRLIEAVAAAGGLSGKGAFTFPNISRWRRKTFSDFTGSLRRARRSLPPPTPQFDPATTAANLAAQTVASRQPQPRVPARPSRCRSRHRGLDNGTRGRREVALPAARGAAKAASADERRGGIVVAESVSHFIGGRHVRSALLKTFGADDPATGKEYVQVAVGVAADINQAVLAAQAALETGPWADMAPSQRAAVLNRIADAIDARAGDIADAEALCTGLPIARPGNRPSGRPRTSACAAGLVTGRAAADASTGPAGQLGCVRAPPGRRRRADHVLAHAVPRAGQASRARPGCGLHGRAQAR